MKEDTVKLVPTERPLSVPYNGFAALMMDVILVVLTWRLADFTGWYVIRRRDNYPSSDTWYVTSLVALFVILMVNLAWIYKPRFQVWCWDVITHPYTFATLAMLLVVTRIMLEYYHPAETAPWKEQVIWGSLLNTWLTIGCLWLGAALMWLQRRVEDYQLWPPPY